MTDYKELIDNLKYLSDADRYPIVNGLHAGGLMEDAADAIEQLVGISEQFKKERDALLSDFLKGFKAQVKKRHGIYRCDICKYGFENNPQENGCQKEHCDGYTNWEWRGVQKNNDE